MLLHIRNLAKQILCQHLYLLLLPLSLIYTGIKPNDTKHGRGGEQQQPPTRLTGEEATRPAAFYPSPLMILTFMLRSPEASQAQHQAWLGDGLEMMLFLLSFFFSWFFFCFVLFVGFFSFVHSFVRFLAAYFRGPDRHCDDI